MADLADLADEKIAMHQAAALAAASGKGGPESHPDFDGVHCVECEDDVHPARLALGKVRCIDCQRRLERERAMRAA